MSDSETGARKTKEGPLGRLARLHPATWAGRSEVQFRIPGYIIDYYFRGVANLVVTFDFMMSRNAAPATAREGWGKGFLQRRGVSALHVKPMENCWYRKPSLESFFRDANAAGLFDVFANVMTYGGSMGGFGALSFAGLANARRCLAMNPQVRLGPDVRDWEDRFLVADRQDWDGPLCDINRQIAGLETVVLVYDPYCVKDRRHVDMIGGDNVVRLKAPFLEHHVPVHLGQMGILGQLFRDSMAGTVDELKYARLMRGRRKLARYRNVMLSRTEGRPCRARIVRRGTRGSDLGIK